MSAGRTQFDAFVDVAVDRVVDHAKKNKGRVSLMHTVLDTCHEEYAVDIIPGRSRIEEKIKKELPGWLVCINVGPSESRPHHIQVTATLFLPERYR